ncbi:MAG TPA: thymidine kinase, partial [Microbacterium sp.]|nr:thymidine kinase [Microbacterium sp.]
LGVSRTVDFLISPAAPVAEIFRRERARVQAEHGVDVSCLLIDEAQFLTPAQVDDLFRIAINYDIPVLAYGIRSDFLTAAFPGSRRLLEIAHSLEELKTICRCGRKAVFNGRVIDGGFVFDGDQVAIDEGGAQAEHVVTYESLCGACYLQESGDQLGRPLEEGRAPRD